MSMLPKLRKVQKWRALAYMLHLAPHILELAGLRLVRVSCDTGTPEFQLPQDTGMTIYASYYELYKQ